FHERPHVIPEPDALVIDEGFSGGAISDEPVRLSLAEIQGADIQPAHTDRVDAWDADRLQGMRGNLIRALQDHGDGPIRREILVQHGVTAADAGSAYRLEYNRKVKVDIWPGMDPAVRQEEVKKYEEHN
ncbi:hypothetical protein, partial [Klebsiella pneumoniae]|uniref:hypothetical protein n=1 Tax=Klebsiella pneumoniae TaxID=573 RepID=UPI001F5D1820